MGRSRMTDKNSIYKLLFAFFMLLGVAARTVGFGAIPDGINQDEAFAAYEAWSLLKYGTDTAGYAFPVYLTAWGSGMNVLESYLMMPFIALFGLETWAVRMPQLIVGLLSLWVVWLMLRHMVNEKAALSALFLLAVSPWHVLLSRWALESNLAPGFLLFGMYFFVRGLDDSRFMLLSALMYGLSLYSYAAIWPVVPLMLLLMVFYCLYCGQVKPDRYMLFAAALLFALALPLLLFLAVNFRLMGEIKTAFFSIPKLLYMRAGEFSASNIGENLRNLLNLVVKQNDGLIWNTAGDYGLFDKFSLPFTLLGIGCSLYDFARGLKGRDFCPETLLLIQLLSALLLGATIDANVNRVNILFMPLVIFTALGIYRLCAMTRKELAAVFALLYITAFIGFQGYYFGNYRINIAYNFSYGLEYALDAVQDYEGTVYISDEYLYPVVLFYTETPVDEFRDSVEYRSYPAAYLKARSFGRYSYDFDPASPTEGVYLLSPWEDRSAFEAAGFDMKYYGYCTLAVKKG